MTNGTLLTPNGVCDDPDRDNLEDRRNRMLQHAIHEEACFYSRLNFFAVVETVLLAIFAQSGTIKTDTLLSGLVAFTGVCTSIVWAIAQIRIHRYANMLGDRLRKELPEFRDNKEVREHRNVPATARAMMAYIIPPLFALVWLILFFAMIPCPCG